MRILSILINALCLVILADAVLSWVIPATDAFPRNISSMITTPLYAPIHAVFSPKLTGNIDLAPLILLIALQAIDRAIKKRSRHR
ncbi:MAG: YggT family protein [Deltaproteobacteria bacterium]|nr:YggT family protein [Deltaproteobacteria bacterium]